VVPLLVGLAVLAWVVAVLGELGGEAALLHHHALIDTGPPLFVAVPLFLVGWQVMVAGMMIPGSVPAIVAFERLAGQRPRRQRAMGGFLITYFVVWTAFGLIAFAGDVAFHAFVHATPWLVERSWLIEAGVVALAGAYQFMPIKRQSLAACRHPRGAGGVVSSGVAAGTAHALDCLGSSWALMLLMFAAGFANLWWMAGLTAVMVYEARGRHGQQATKVVGAVLLGLSVYALAGGGLPAWLPA
jgi:predicted metal-binding membrane protein